MPTYEYVCEDCRKKVSLFYLSIRQAEQETPKCPLCEGTRLRRLVSRFAWARASGSPVDGKGDDIPGMSDLESGDPRSIARWMRQMSDEVGEPIEPEMESVLTRLESGEDPEKIESELSDAGGPAPTGGTEPAGDA